MKLKKREITLNEADSLEDMRCFLQLLKTEYSQGESKAFRKETLHVLFCLMRETEGEEKEMERLVKKSKANQL